MHGNRHLALAIGKDVVTAADADQFEPIGYQRFDDLFTVHGF